MSKILGKDYQIVQTPIIYPQQARMNGTEGRVILGYVFTKECEAKEMYLFKDIGDGCGQALINAIKEVFRKLRELGCKQEKVVFEVVETDYILQ